MQILFDPAQRSFQSSVRCCASGRRRTRIRPLWVRGVRAALIGLILLQGSAALLHAQSRTASSAVVLQVRPEERLEEQLGRVILRIRIARGTTARIWAANSCAASSFESQVITQSGNYSFPLSALTGESSHPGADALQVCLTSSDGALSDSLPVEPWGSEEYPGVQGTASLAAPGGMAVDAPDGRAVITPSGIKTWANP